MSYDSGSDDEAGDDHRYQPKPLGSRRPLPSTPLPSAAQMPITAFGSYPTSARGQTGATAAREAAADTRWSVRRSGARRPSQRLPSSVSLEWSTRSTPIQHSPRQPSVAQGDGAPPYRGRAHAQASRPQPARNPQRLQRSSTIRSGHPRDGTAASGLETRDAILLELVEWDDLAHSAPGLLRLRDRLAVPMGHRTI